MLRQVLSIIREGVAKAPKIQWFASYQNETSHATFAHLLNIRKLWIFSIIVTPV